MTTLDRYILKTFARNLALVLLTLLALYGLVEFLEKVDDLLEHRAAFRYYLLYPLYHLPVMLANSLPMAVLLATFATVGGLSRTNQLTAMLSSGIGFGRIARPLFLGSLALAALALAAGLWLVPWSARETAFMMRSEITGNAAAPTVGKDLYFRDGDRIVSVAEAFPAKNLLLGLTILDLDDDFKPVRRIQAERASHESNGAWRLQNAVSWDFRPADGGVAAFTRQTELRVDLGRQPSELLRRWDNPEDLTIGELGALADRLAGSGHDPLAYRLEARMRYARAAIPVIMVLVGIPFALQRGRDASFARGIVASLLIFCAYFVLHAIFAVFGAVAVLPPVVAAWAANVLMALVGSWQFLRLQG